MSQYIHDNTEDELTHEGHKIAFDDLGCGQELQDGHISFVSLLLSSCATAKLLFAKIPAPTVAATPATKLCLINKRRLTRAFS